MNKTVILLENMGANCRIKLKAGQDEVANNMFRNLLWASTEYPKSDDDQTFVVPANNLAKAVQAYRAANWKQPRRGKGQWKASPFLFMFINQYHMNKADGLEDYSTGRHHDNEDDVQWMPSKFAKNFDSVEKLEKAKERI